MRGAGLAGISNETYRKSMRTRIDRLAGVIIRATNGIRLTRTFVSKEDLERALCERGYELMHAHDGIWVAIKRTAGPGFQVCCSCGIMIRWVDSGPITTTEECGSCAAA